MKDCITQNKVPFLKYHRVGGTERGRGERERKEYKCVYHFSIDLFTVATIIFLGFNIIILCLVSQ